MRAANCGSQSAGPPTRAAQRSAASAPRRRTPPAGDQSVGTAGQDLAADSTAGSERRRLIPAVRLAAVRRITRGVASTANRRRSRASRRGRPRRGRPGLGGQLGGQIGQGHGRGHARAQTSGREALLARRVVPGRPLQGLEGMFGQPAGNSPTLRQANRPAPAWQTAQTNSGGSRASSSASRCGGLRGGAGDAATRPARRPSVGHGQDPAVRAGNQRGRLRMAPPLVRSAAVTRRERPRCPGDGTSAPRASPPRTACA